MYVDSLDYSERKPTDRCAKSYCELFPEGTKSIDLDYFKYAICVRSPLIEIDRR